jgi:hypothetical protein
MYFFNQFAQLISQFLAAPEICAPWVPTGNGLHAKSVFSVVAIVFGHAGNAL